MGREDAFHGDRHLSEPYALAREPSSDELNYPDAGADMRESGSFHVEYQGSRVAQTVSHETLHDADQNERSPPISFWHTDIPATESQSILPDAGDTIGGDQFGQYIPAMQSTERRSGRSAKLKRLREKHTEMSRLRKRVEIQKDELQPDYEAFNAEMEEVRASLEELMNALREERKQAAPTGTLEMVDPIWERVQSDAATLNARYDRIRQLENLAINPQAELILAEEDFVEAAERTVASKSKAALSESPQPRDPETGIPPDPSVTYDRSRAVLSGLISHDEVTQRELYLGARTWSPLEQPVTPSHHSDQDPLEIQSDGKAPSSPTPPELSRLQNRRTELRFYKERLNELDWDQDEDKLDRELLVDRGDEPGIPEAEFEGTYLGLREGILKDIKDAEADIARMEEDCRAQGIDIDLPRRRGSASSMAYQSAAGDVLPEQENDFAVEDSAASSQGARAGSEAGADLNQHPSSESLRLTPAKAIDPALIEQWLHDPELSAHNPPSDQKTTAVENQQPASQQVSNDEKLNVPQDSVMDANSVQGSVKGSVREGFR